MTPKSSRMRRGTAKRNAPRPVAVAAVAGAETGGPSAALTVAEAATRIVWSGLPRHRPVNPLAVLTPKLKGSQETRAARATNSSRVPAAGVAAAAAAVASVGRRVRTEHRPPA